MRRVRVPNAQDRRVRFAKLRRVISRWPPQRRGRSRSDRCTAWGSCSRQLSESYDAAEAGFKVGYDDASHFSRDYKRHFGKPPMRDVERLRELAGAST